MAVGDSASGLADQGGGPSIQKGGPEGVFQLSGDHTPQPPLENLFQGTGEENSADGQTSDSGRTMRFSSWTEHWNSSIPFTGCSKDHVCFVDLEKAWDCVSHSILWEVLREYSLFITFMDRISRRRGSGSGATGFHLCFLWAILSCLLRRARTSSMSLVGL